ncbi:MAG: PilZ domain-containing protein [Vibrio sp.]|uniref:PilZ domain-containing protein n=1 Tax=Vibrio sp. TaxID=678 RepID=UPI003A859A26
MQQDERRQDKRYYYVNNIPAICLFNRWYMPAIRIKIIDVSEHGMKFFTRSQLSMSGATIYFNFLDNKIKGEIIWQKKTENGYLCGFEVRSGHSISNDDISLISVMDDYLSELLTKPNR